MGLDKSYFSNALSVLSLEWLSKEQKLAKRRTSTEGSFKEFRCRMNSKKVALTA